MATTRRTKKTDDTASTNGTATPETPKAPRRRKPSTTGADAADVASEADTEPAPAPPASGDDAAPDATDTPEEARPPKRRRTAKPTEPALTMSRLRDLYLDELERAGKSLGTRFSYGVDLAVACGSLGPDTKVADLTVDDVRRFFDSDVVTKTRTGKTKSPLTIDKTRRVLRLALVWAAGTGLLESAPIPLDAIPTRRRKSTAHEQPTASDDPS